MLKKRILSALLAAALITSAFAGCTSKDSGSSTSSKDESSTAKVSSESVVESQDESGTSGETSTKFDIGVVLLMKQQ